MFPEILPDDGFTFFSDDYVIHRIREDESAGTLSAKYLGDAKKNWKLKQANGGVSFKAGEIIVIPLKEPNRGGLKKYGYQMVPILCYHRFGAKSASPLSMPSAFFENQMKFLKQNGYKTVTMGELLKFIEFKEAIPDKSFCITIDDGYRSAYDIAFPIIRKYGFTATLFVYTDFVGISRTAVTWAQLREMKQYRCEIGSHTVSHCDLTRKLKGESDGQYMARIRRELEKSRRIIDRKLNQKTDLLAFPYGRYNQTVLDLTRASDYKLGFTVQRGSNPFFADRLLLKRNQILSKDISYLKRRMRTIHRISLE